MNWRERIEINPEVCGGEPHIKGLQVPVSAITKVLANGGSMYEVMEANPGLNREDIHAAMVYTFQEVDNAGQ